MLLLAVAADGRVNDAVDQGGGGEFAVAEHAATPVVVGLFERSDLTQQSFVRESCGVDPVGQCHCSPRIAPVPASCRCVGCGGVNIPVR